MNKIPIVMPIYDRPHYLKQVLDALRKCSHIDKFYIETFEENGRLEGASTIEENTDLLEAIDWIEVRRNINTGVMGCAANVVQGIDHVCQDNDYFVLLEDDIVPAVDFLNLMLFGFKHLTGDMGWVHANAHNPKAYIENKDLYDKVQRNNFFVCWGWGSSRNVWLKFRKDFDVNVYPKASWAMPLGIWLMKKKYFGYNSLIGRSQNIGETGTFQNDPKRHRAEIYNEYWYGFAHAPVEEFKILNKNKTEFLDPDVYRTYMSGIIGDKDFRKCFTNWEDLCS